MAVASDLKRDVKVPASTLNIKISLEEKKDLKTSQDHLIISIAKKIFDFFKGIYDFIYAKNEVTKRREFWFVPTAFEKFTGYWMYPSHVSAEGGKTFDVASSILVQNIGKNLTKDLKRNFDWEFTQIRSLEINAFCLPGGKVGIYDGIIEGIEKVNIPGYEELSKADKIAAVLAHEIIHAEARHTARRVEKTFILNVILFAIRICTDIFLFRVFKPNLEDEKSKKPQMYFDIAKYITQYLMELFTKLYLLAGSRAHEYEADKYGMYLMKRTGYDPKAALWLQEFFMTRQLQIPNWRRKIQQYFSTHPSSKNRLEKNKQTLADIEKNNLN